MEALARTLAQHGSGIVLLRQSHVAICCYQIMSYMIYIYMYICHIKSICFFVFFRALELPGPGLMMAELDSGLQRAKACE